MYTIKEIIMDKEQSIGLIPVGFFLEEKDRDDAYDKYFMAKDRKALRGEE